MTKAAYAAFVPVDLKPSFAMTPSFFAQDARGTILTTLRAAKHDDSEMLSVLRAVRGMEGTPEADAMITQLLMGRTTAYQIAQQRRH